MSVETSLDIESIGKLLQADGRFQMLLAGFEARPEQQKMLADVVRAYNENAIALIEAGTSA